MPSKRPLRHLTPGAVAGTTRTSRTSDAEWIVGRNEEDVDTDGVSDLENGTESEVRRMEQSLKKSMATDAGLRKEQKQQQLEKGFETQVRVLEGRIDERAHQYQQQSTRIQNDQLARLLALSQRKAEVEGQIIQHTRELADAYTAAKEEFEAVLKGRHEDVRAAIRSLDQAEEKALPK